MSMITDIAVRNVQTFLTACSVCAADADHVLGRQFMFIFTREFQSVVDWRPVKG